MKKYRLAIIASHVIQYQDPFFRLVAGEPSLDPTVLYCSRAGADLYRDKEMGTDLRWDIELLQGYRYRFLRNFGFGRGYTRLVNPAVVPAIVAGRFDAVLLFLGWGTISSLLAIATCMLTRTPFLLYGDSSFPPPSSSWRERVRASFLRALFRRASGVMASGVLNAEYYRHYGVAQDRIFSLPWAIDNERFSSAGRLSAEERAETRRRAGFAPDEVVFVFSAKLIDRKDPLTLLKAVVQMRNRRRAAVLFLGHGALHDTLSRYAREHELHVEFAGFVNQSELPRHYAMADVFVLPSTYEPRGAVINEAMACGLPVVVTDRCGSLGDIVRDRENALVYPAGDAVALARHLDLLVDEPALRGRMAGRSLEIISTWDFASGVAGLKNALEVVAQ